MTAPPTPDRQWLNFDLKVASHVARVSSRQLLAAAEISEAAFADREADLFQLTMRIWKAAEQLSGRPEAAAEVINHLTLDQFGDFGLVTLTSENFAEALDTLVSLSAAVTQQWRYTIEPYADFSRIVIRPVFGPEHNSHHCIDSSIACGIYLARLLLANNNYNLVRVNLNHPDFGRKTEYETLYGCPCRFEQAASSVDFGQHSLLHPMPMRNTAIHANLFAQLERQLAKHMSMTQQVSLAIHESLAAQQWPSRQRVAQRIGVGERTMLRQLSAAGLTYRDLLESLLEQESRQLLLDGFSAEAIAEKLGYAGSSPLARMLKRRTGKTIRELRQQ